MKDLPCDLYGSDDCGKTFVKEDDILRTNHAVRRPVSNYVRGKGKARTAALRAASEAP